MLYLNYNEQQQHGTGEFPVAFYHIDRNHPRYEMPFHWHKEYEIVRILDGSLRLTLDETEITANAGEGVFIPSGAIHGGTPDDCVYECLVFDLDMLFIHADRCRHYLKQITHQDVRIHSLITSATPSLQKAVERLLAYAGEMAAGGELIVTGCLFEILGLIFHEKCYELNETPDTTPLKHTKQLKSVFEYIENNYASAITLQQLSRISGMSPKYFCRYFRTIAHKTPMDYLNYYRIERSCSLLCTTELPIASIAYDCGFNDCSYFIKLFKRYKNTTPKQYQLQMRQS